MTINNIFLSFLNLWKTFLLAIYLNSIKCYFDIITCQAGALTLGPAVAGSYHPTDLSLLGDGGQLTMQSDNQAVSRILNSLASSFKLSRESENQALKNMASEFETLLRQVSASVLRENARLKAAEAETRGENNRIKSENKKLEQRITSLISSQQKLTFQMEEFKHNSVSKSSLKKCEVDLVHERKSYQAVIPKLQDLKRSFQSSRSPISKIIQAYKTYKNMFQLKQQSCKKNEMLIKNFRSVAKKQLQQFSKLQDMVQGALHRQEGNFYFHR